ncbi:MAG TPA: hypothetical protein ENH62_02400 [Marinobacter sp.]|uniref:Uncharacterized protein n=1 Tax=marine sediment metagenome TaxID=412755 RepID=A0A0F9TS43_9ZZZZ|nr:hypothetical protein [Marinobacter sp.]
MTQPEIIPSKDVPLRALTPSEVLRRLRRDMPKDAPIPASEGGGFLENGIEGALNQLYSYDKDAVIDWFLSVPEMDKL